LAEWRNEIALLAVIGIVYGATVALVQKDFKFVIGYSSVSQMGFVILGLVTISSIGTVGLSGAVLQMFSHGIIAGLLFGVVGRMVYDRTHTRDLPLLEGMGLSRAIPFAAGTFAVAGFASMGLPGFSGFAAEFQVLLGAWQSFPTFAVLAGFGVLVGIAYTLRVIQKVFFNETVPASEAETHPLPPISVPERIGAVILIAATLIIGIYPNLLLNLINPSFDSPLFEAMRKAGGS
jgi:NADH-quinone oxidoreductase subunit M